MGFPVAGYANLPLCTVVVGCEILITNRPVAKRAPFWYPIAACHTEVIWMKPPSLCPIDPRSAAKRHRIIMVIPFKRHRHSLVITR
ncbi:hypothetical protein D3C84_922040 [compost metagenome]